jgi:hypothetical protein
MDVEQTIQFILQSQAQMQANVGRHEEMIATLAKSHDRVSAAILDLTEVMRRMKIETDERFRETDEQIKDLARMQRETREDLNIVIRAMDDWIRRK